MGGVEVDTRMGAESPGLLKNARDIEFRARAQCSPQGHEKRRGRTVFFGNRVKPSDRERSQCCFGGGKRENK